MEEDEEEDDCNGITLQASEKDTEIYVKILDDAIGVVVNVKYLGSYEFKRFHEREQLLYAVFRINLAMSSFMRL